MASKSVGCRRLWSLIENLPPESALHRDGEVWGDLEHLIATLGDLLATAYGIKTKDGKTFSMPRPGVITKAEPASIQTMKSLLKGG